MTEGYEVDPGALGAVGDGLSRAEGVLGGAAGAGLGADAGVSTAVLIQVAGLQAKGMMAVGQALGRSAADLSGTAAAYAEAESATAGLFPGGG